MSLETALTNTNKLWASIKDKHKIHVPTSTRWRLEARLRRTKANSPICASDIPTYKMKLLMVSFKYLNKKEVISLWRSRFVRIHLTRSEVLLVYPNPLTTAVTTTVFITMTNITAASKISMWFHRKWTWISIPMLARKRAAKKLRMGST